MVLSLESHALSQQLGHVRDAWYYEDPAGIGLYARVDVTDVNCNPLIITINIPWRKLRASLRRKDALKNKKKKR